MVAKNMEKVIDGHNNKVKNTLLNITGLSLISNVWRKGIGGVFGGGDDDEEV